MSWGLVYALNIPYTNLKGALIGSPIAAGIASLVVTHREEVKKRTMKKEVFQELQQRVLRRRWLDDAVQVQRGELTEEAKKELECTQGETFYGPSLRLLPVKGSEAFGFLLDSDSTGRVRVQQKCSYVHKKEEFKKCFDAGLHLHVGLNGGVQYRGVAVEQGVVLGHFIRILDTTNLPGEDLEGVLMRLGAELILAGTSRRVVAKAARKVVRLSERKWPGLLSLVLWSSDKLTEWTVAYDEKENMRW